MNISKLTLFVLSFLMLSCAHNLNKSSTIDPTLEAHQAIRVDSELFDNLKKIAYNDDCLNENSVCLDFIYPVTLFVFDEDDVYLYTSTIRKNEEFRNLLGTLNVNFTISMNFPIIKTIESGEISTIHNKKELKAALYN
ncbi:hypothetical protein [uncultured Psychroserpens sp.]|uniref:hypothetical protein n=1 Tax=uncultured Psychroserpens sp. TaxID=255436 RepID=UPI0026355625|nr:hypothetical protein [uncultured Psychroserpens sp.]